MKDTLKSPPPESETMKKASTLAITVTTLFYLFCGGFGYAAFGDDTPGNLLTGFGFYEPYWLVDFANACVVAHLVGGYQVLLSNKALFILLITKTTACTSCKCLFLLFSDIHPTTIRNGGQMVCPEVPQQWICKQQLRLQTAIVASIQSELVQTLFQNSLCWNNNWNSHDLPILQPGFGGDRSHELLALGYIFSSGNVLCAEENWSLDKNVASSSNI